MTDKNRIIENPGSLNGGATGEAIEHKASESFDAQLALIFALAQLADSRDDESGSHLERIRGYCKLLTEKLCKNVDCKTEIAAKFVENIFRASPLHDIGKVAICDEILLKSGKLTTEEFEIVKIHTTIGAATLQAVLDKFPDNDFIKMGVDIANFHHERWDGNGYPTGLRAKNIPLAARIIAVADIYDALSSERVYKKAYPHQLCCEIIAGYRNTRLDPAIVDIFLDVADDFRRLRLELAE